MLLSQTQISVLSGDHELVHTEHVKLCYVVLPNESFDSSSDNSSLNSHIVATCIWVFLKLDSIKPS